MKYLVTLLLLAIVAQVSYSQVLWIDKDATVSATANQPMVPNLFDNDISTTWSFTGSAEVEFLSAGNPLTYIGYAFYINDAAQAPGSWRLYGSINGTNYDTLDTRAQFTFEDTTRTRYTFDNAELYDYYRLELFDGANFIHSGNEVVLSGFLFLAEGNAESFEKLKIGNGTNESGVYTGDNSIEWTFNRSRDGQNYGAEGRSLMMRGQDKANLTAILEGGVTRLSFDYTRAFATAANDTAFFKVFLEELETGKAEELVGTTDPVGKTPIIGIKTYFLDSLDFRGQVKLRIEAAVKPVCVDNLGYIQNPLLPEPQEDTVTNNHFTIKTAEVKWKISDFLVGMHSVYSFEPDTFFTDGSFAAWMKTAEVSTMRYPGGTVVKHWDWENPTGVLNGDSWKPNWDPANNQPPENWQSLDEYIDLVKKSGITPMFGVNITSGHKYNRVQESVDRAVRMVQYVKDQGLGGAFWYLGNEGENGGRDNEARLFVRHAEAMKAIDPGIKCMFNHNNLTPSYLKGYLAIAGDYVDIAETHGKWPYGGTPNLPPGTFWQWQNELPLRDRKNRNRAWRDEVPALQQAAIEAGYPDLKFANNEYGLGKNSNLIGFDRYSKSLLIVDLLQEHFIGNWYMSCYWSVLLGSDQGSVASRGNGYRLNPMHYCFQLLGKAQGGNMLEMMDEGNVSVYGFAAEKEGEYLLYLINKANTDQTVNVILEGLSGIKTELHEGSTMINTEDGFGALVTTTASLTDVNAYSAVLPSLSYTRMIFKKKVEEPPTEPTPVTAMEDPILQKAILLHPNPTSIGYIVPHATGDFTPRHFIIKDMSGRMIKKGGLTRQKKIELDGMPQGVYLVQFTDREGTSFVRKMIVQ